MAEVYFSLGSNLGDRKATIQKALKMMEERFSALEDDERKIVKLSSFLETEPWGFSAPTPFINCAVRFDLVSPAEEILRVCKEIERELGRETSEPRYDDQGKRIYSSRPIDIDILLYGTEHIQTPSLTVPHPLMRERDFVMTPLREILPDIPETGETAAPVVSVVIVCMNRLDNLYPCLESLRKHTSVPFEALVVAYMFSRENLQKAKEDFPWVRFIESRELRGFSENNNLALNQVRGRYCFVLNDDTEIHSDTISRLVEDFEKLPGDAAIVAPRLDNADGTLQLCGRPPYPSRYYALQQWHLHREPIDDRAGKTPIFDEVYQTSNISGAAFLIPTDVFRSLGWFDEKYYFTPEDIALSTLARKRGYSVWVDAGAVVVHKWRTTASRLSPAVRPAAVRGSLIFFSEDSALKYFLLALCVWTAEMGKRVKAAIRLRLDSSDENKTKLLTFRNITRSIFTRRTPKEIFVKYYNEIVGGQKR